ncbi:ATP-binding protein [Paucibacter sp. XJ19-41]|uniref:ATP-binding protein n=1 Tax=Paucibacter sp. XJ19-41 TaxID=2927824 RepID=UPI0023493B12|nr:ATP-binding protein [Paucibacter sp. XJ19-41]MDC6169610.1 ATP-binding protein [Paucibacter sp. XJ19-41]
MTDSELIALQRANQQLRALNESLRSAQDQLLQSERLASIGQLAAGVAHEINKPIGYVFSNSGTLQAYLERLFEMLEAYEQAETALADSAVATRLAALRERVELDYLKQDIPMLMGESKEGLSRVRQIVQDLKDFSRVDTNQDWVWASLHQGIDSTLNIVANEIKYRAEVRRAYGDLPDIECLPSELNQVFLNLLVNAAHAIGPERGLIVVRSGVAGDKVWVEVEDDGCGIAPDHLARVFDPFFTTKPVGRGTGLGLSLAYGIVQKHQGRIDVRSEPGNGSCFRVTLPVRRAGAEGAAT